MVRVEILSTALPVSSGQVPSSGSEGAVVEFRGIVRGTEEGLAIRGIDYECHEEMAQHQLDRIARETASSHALSELIVLHRIGYVGVGEASLYVRATAAHRGEAFRAVIELIDLLKRDVPIWKHAIPA